MVIVQATEHAGTGELYFCVDVFTFLQGVKLTFGLSFSFLFLTKCVVDGTLSHQSH